MPDRYQPIWSGQRRLCSPVFVGTASHVLFSALIALEYILGCILFPPGCGSQHEQACAAFGSCASPASLFLFLPAHLQMGDSVCFMWAIKAFKSCLCLPPLHPWTPHMHAFFNDLRSYNEDDWFRISANQTEIQQ